MTVRQWPFVGRDALQATLIERINAQRHVVVTGSAGLGKSRLAAQAAHHFAELGVTVTRVVASPASAPIPLAPFAQLINDEIGADVVPRILRTLNADGRSGPGDPVLLIDDLHVLDDSSATVTHQLALTGKVRILATLRSGAPPPAAITRLLHESCVVVESIPPLNDADIIAMVTAALNGSLDARSQRVLCQVAAGNPLYVRELVEGSIAAGVLTSQARVWQFDGDMASTPLLEEVVLARLSALPSAQLETLELLAVCGQMRYATLAAIVGADTLEQLERSDVIRAEGTGRSMVIDVGHPLYRELVRAKLGPLARMRAYHTVATTEGPPTANQSSAETLRSAVAHVRGGVELAATTLIDAARHALQAGDTPLAAELAEASFRASDDGEAALLASWCLGECGHHDESRALLADALAVATDPWQRAAIAGRTTEELWWTGQTSAALGQLEVFIATDPAWRDLLTAQRGVFAVLDGDLAEAAAMCGPLADHPHLWVRFIAAIGLGIGGIYGDDTATTMDVCSRMMAQTQQSNVSLIGEPNLHLAIQMIAMLHAGEVSVAHDFAAAGYSIAGTQPSRQVRAWAAMIYGQAAATVGNSTSAARLLAEAERLWAGCGIGGVASWCGAGLARAQVEIGATDEADDTMRRVLGYQRSGFALNQVIVDIAHAWVENAKNNDAAATSHLVSAVERAVDHQQWTHVATVWHEAARLGLADQVNAAVDPAVALDEWKRPTSTLSQLRFDLVQARRLHDTAALESVAAGFEEMGCLLYAAETYAMCAAELRRSDGSARNGKAISRLDGRSATLVSGIGGATTPPLASRPSAGPLSVRELEIATLAANGYTNRNIADRLVVSERTVENHLYRIFIKLGVSSRDQLSATRAEWSPAT